MSGPLLSMSSRLFGQSSTRPCGYRNVIPLLRPTSLLSTMTYLIIWTAWWELWLRRSLNGRKTYSWPWSLRGRSCSNIRLKSLQRLVCSILSAHILDPFRQLRWFRKWVMGIDINSEDKTSYTIQYQEVFLKYVENEYCAKHQRLPFTEPETIPDNHLVSSAMASIPGQYSYDPYDLSSDDEEYLMLSHEAKTTPGRSYFVAFLLTATRLHLNSPSDLPQNWGQINPNLKDNHSNLMESSSTFRLPDSTDGLWQQDETHSKYADLSNVVRDIFSIIPHGVRVEASSSVGRDVFRWMQSTTTGETVRKRFVVRQFAWANTGLQASDDSELDSTRADNEMEMKREAKQKKLHPIPKVHDFVEIRQESQIQRATQKKSRAKHKQMPAVGYISDAEEIVKVSWSLFQHDGAAAFMLSEKSPVPLSLSAKDLPGGRNQILNVRWIKPINCHPAESDEDSSPESILDTENWINWNGYLDNPGASMDDWEADNESDMELDNGTEDSKTRDPQNVSGAPNLLGFIRPIWRTKTSVENALMTVNIIETRRNMVIGKCRTEFVNVLSPSLLCSLTKNFIYRYIIR